MASSPDWIVSRSALHDILQKLGAQLERRNGPFYVYKNRNTGLPFIVEWDKWDFTWAEAMLIVTKHGFDTDEFAKLYQSDYGFTEGGNEQT